MHALLRGALLWWKCPSKHRLSVAMKGWAWSAMMLRWYAVQTLLIGDQGLKLCQEDIPHACCQHQAALFGVNLVAQCTDIACTKIFPSALTLLTIWAHYIMAPPHPGPTPVLSPYYVRPSHTGRPCHAAERCYRILTGRSDKCQVSTYHAWHLFTLENFTGTQCLHLCLISVFCIFSLRLPLSPCAVVWLVWIACCALKSASLFFVLCFVSLCFYCLQFSLAAHSCILLFSMDNPALLVSNFTLIPCMDSVTSIQTMPLHHVSMLTLLHQTLCSRVTAYLRRSLVSIDVQRGHEVAVIFWIVILRSQLNNTFITDKYELDKTFIIWYHKIVKS